MPHPREGVEGRGEAAAWDAELGKLAAGRKVRQAAAAEGVVPRGEGDELGQRGEVGRQQVKPVAFQLQRLQVHLRRW